MKAFPAILLIFGIFLAGRASGEEARIRDLSAVARDGSVSVSFRLEGAFEHPEIASALESGLATGFTYHVQLIRKRENWFDDTLQTVRIEVISTYNSVTREYLLNLRRDKLLVRSEVFSSRDDLKRRMSEISEEGLFDLRGRPPHKLVVRARADLMRGYLLYVVPWDVETRWSVARVKASNGGK